MQSHILHFGGVSNRAFLPRQYPAFHDDRLTSRYAEVHSWCKLFIDLLSVSDKPGETRFSGYLLDMNVLFERFVISTFKRARYVFPILLPPLRDRKGDISFLVDHCARQVNAENNWKSRVFTEGAIALLERYEWPGNVRELRNAVERMLLLADDAVDERTVSLALPGLRASEATSDAGTLALRVRSTGPKPSPRTVQ